MFKKILSVAMTLATLSLQGPFAYATLRNLDSAQLGAVQSSDYVGYTTSHVVLGPYSINSTQTITVDQGPLVFVGVQFPPLGATTNYVVIKDTYQAPGRGDVNFPTLYGGTTVYALATTAQIYDAIAYATATGTGYTPSQGVEIEFLRPILLNNGLTFNVSNPTYTFMRFKYKVIR